MRSAAGHLALCASVQVPPGEDYGKGSCGSEVLPCSRPIATEPCRDLGKLRRWAEMTPRWWQVATWFGFSVEQLRRGGGGSGWGEMVLHAIPNRRNTAYWIGNPDRSNQSDLRANSHTDSSELHGKGVLLPAGTSISVCGQPQPCCEPVARPCADHVSSGCCLAKERSDAAPPISQQCPGLTVGLETQPSPSPVAAVPPWSTPWLSQVSLGGSCGGSLWVSAPSPEEGW